tara:strand:- start:117 stop:500 length:384 start_codon:yes stop_codon:yes gene_type:complete
MAKKTTISSSDKITQQTLHEILLDIKYRLDHLEDIEADNRALIVKLVKQGNSIVRYLSEIQIEIDEENFEKEFVLDTETRSNLTSEKTKKLKALLDEFLSRSKELKEFEKELKKHKDEIIPGEIGEA